MAAAECASSEGSAQLSKFSHARSNEIPSYSWQNGIDMKKYNINNHQTYPCHNSR